jgi:hypothetical protein
MYPIKWPLLKLILGHCGRHSVETESQRPHNGHSPSFRRAKERQHKFTARVSFTYVIGKLRTKHVNTTYLVYNSHQSRRLEAIHQCWFKHTDAEVNHNANVNDLKQCTIS